MSDIRALLLTDVVDSTRLSEQLGDAAMAKLWAAHDRAARDLLPAWRGREIDKTDGMLLLFEHAADAVGYAVAYQRSLALLSVPLKARAGLHVGPVILRENRPEDIARGAKPLEVDGLAKPTAARVMSLALGGQILLTPQARQALEASAFDPGDLRLQSHGHWLIKGVSEPLELFEIGTADADFAPPTDSEKVRRVAQSDGRWLPVQQMPNNLPQQVTSFVGRESELDEVKTLLGQTRLVTLLGMGGLGKTRLSLQVAAEVMPDFPDGIWFLDLAPIRDPMLVVDEAAQALGVRETPDRPLIQTLCAFLKTRKLLLIVDNCEHLVLATGELVAAILRAAPQVQAIASSREALHVPGEQVYPLHPLPLPGAHAGHDLALLSKSTAVRLFVERAQAHKPAFVLTAREAPAVAELVSRLEGIPLAIELAAARMRSMGVVDINARVKDRYKLLTGGGRVLLERQQTLRGLVDWSYELLNVHEQTVLNRLGVFAGGFDLEAAEMVCGTGTIDAADVLDLLGSLVEKSLVLLDESNDAPRYRMLETIGDYAREKLRAGPDAATTAEQHCQHYFAFAKTANIGLKGREQADWIVRMEAELDNVRAAIKLSLAGELDPFIAVKFSVAMLAFWMLRGYATEGRGIVRAALAIPAIQASEVAQAWALYVGAGLASSQSDHAQARAMLETCLLLRRQLGNPIDIAATLSTLTMSRLPTGDTAAARQSEEEALAIFRDSDDRMGEVIALVHLGQIHRHTGERAPARARLQQGLAIARELQSQEAEGECELLLCILAFEDDELNDARRHGARSSTVCREAGDRRGDANAQRWLGKIDLGGGDVASARMRLAEALKAYRDFEMRDELLGCLEDHAELSLYENRAPAAVRLLATAAAMRKRLALARAPAMELRWCATVAGLRDAMLPDTFDSAWSEGETWDVATAIGQALSRSAGADEPEVSISPA